MTIFAQGLSVPEGPVPLRDGRWLVVEMGADRGCVSLIDADGKNRRELARTGRPNGLAIDRNDIVWIAESNPPSLLKMTLAGKVDLVADSSPEGPFLFPNDLCFGPDGALYFTDSGVRFVDFAPGGKVRSDYETLSYSGRVHRYDPRSGELVTLADGIRFANGLGFGPNDEHLYVAETISGDIIRYRWSTTELGPAEVFGNVIAVDAPEGIKGPDGFAFAENGDLYVTVFGQGDVTVLAPDGSVKTRIKTAGAAPTNVKFGLGEQRIYVTEDQHGTIETYDVGVSGLPLHQSQA